MAKLTTSDLVNLQNETTAVTTINNNNALIETALENTLSRDGTAPNEMEADLDMNGHNIINLTAPNDPTSPVRVQDLETYIDQINGVGSSSVVSSPTAGEVHRIAKATAAGVVGFGQVEIDGSHNLYPTTNDVGSLGLAAKSFSDLFLASGAVCNWNNGNYTITHSAGNLAFSGTTTLTGVVTATAGVRPLANDGAALGSSTLSWADLFLANGAVINFNNSNYTLTHSAGALTASGSLTAEDLAAVDDLTVGDDATVSGALAVATTIDTGALLKVGAGTSVIAPLKLTAGTNLTTPAAGCIEFDGNCVYGTNNATIGRGLIPVTQMNFLSANRTLANDNSTQALFGTSQDAFNLVANQAYRFEGWFLVYNGATTHTTAFSPLGAGTATITTLWEAETASGAVEAILTAASRVVCNDTANKVLNATSTAVVTFVKVNGTIRCTAAGTLIPSIAFSAAPGLTGPNSLNEVVAGSYFTITCLGADTVTQIGAQS